MALPNNSEEPEGGETYVKRELIVMAQEPEFSILLVYFFVAQIFHL
jgi:hypothetical protein